MILIGLQLTSIAFLDNTFVGVYQDINLSFCTKYVQGVLALCYFWDLEKIRISQKSY